MIDIGMIKKELATAAKKLTAVIKENSELSEQKRSLLKRENELRRKILELQMLLLSCGEDDEA